MRRFRWGWTLGGVAVVALAAASFVVVQQQIPQQLALASGFKAKTLCAGLFVQGLDQKRLEAEDSGFNSLFGLLSAQVDAPNQAVTCSLLGTGLFAAKAIHVPGLGAVLLAGRSEAEVRALGPGPASGWKPGLRDPRPWPLGDAPDTEMVPAGVDRVAVEGVVDQTFREDDPKHLKRTRAIVVLVGGQLVAERYAEGLGPDHRFLAWSMAKSVTNTLVGLASQRNLIGIYAPAPVPEWKAPDPRAVLTPDLLMRMSSGLSFFEDYTEHPISDVNQMLFLEPDFAAFAAQQPLVATPGLVWNYSSGSTAIVSRALRSVLGGDRSYWTFPQEALFGPLGMHSVEFGVDASGTFAGSSYLYATARDYARLGLFWLRDGVWDGKRLLPPGWMAYSTTPTPPAPQGSYGAFFWLNAGTAGKPEDRTYPDMPTDLFWANGHNGQAIFVVPSLDLVAVRLGMTWDGDWGEGEFLSGLRRAVGAVR